MNEGSLWTDELTGKLVELDPSIRYVAHLHDQKLDSWERSSGAASSSSESDRYEELFVNPALLALLEARAASGCGGLEFVIIRYGNFFQIVQRLTRTSHLSICVSADGDPLAVQAKAEALLAK